MRCAKHAENDAVGTCVYCGRGVCSSCTERAGNRIHCKECIKAGRIKIKNVPEVQCSAEGQPKGPVPLFYYGYTEYPEVNSQRLEPEPVGPPKPGLFKMGALGSKMCAVVSIIFAFQMLPIILSWSSSSETVDVFYILSISLSILLIIGSVFYALGLNGIRWNFGPGIPRLCGAGIIASMIALLIVWVLMYWMWLTRSSLSGAMALLPLLGYSFPLGIVSMLSTISFWSLLPYLPVGGKGRTQVLRTMVLFSVSSILFLCLVGFYLVGWLVLSIAYGSGASVFSNIGKAEEPLRTKTLVERMQMMTPGIHQQ